MGRLQEAGRSCHVPPHPHVFLLALAYTCITSLPACRGLQGLLLFSAPQHERIQHRKWIHYFFNRCSFITSVYLSQLWSDNDSNWKLNRVSAALDIKHMMVFDPYWAILSCEQPSRSYSEPCHHCQAHVFHWKLDGRVVATITKSLGSNSSLLSYGLTTLYLAVGWWTIVAGDVS